MQRLHWMHEVEPRLAVWDSFESRAPTVLARLIVIVRRAAPAALAVSLHAAGLAALIWLAASPQASETPRQILNVELVTPAPLPTPEPQSQPESRPEMPLETVIEPVPQIAAQQEISVPIEPTTAIELAQDVANSAPGAEEGGSGGGALSDVDIPRFDIPDTVVLDAPGGAAGETPLPTRASALRGLACARAFGAARDQIGCEGAPGAGFGSYADGEGTAQIEALMQARFNALAGLYGARLDPSLRRLPGQQGMQVMVNQRMGVSGSDEMRDSLPPMVPDPAFGD